MVIPPERRGQGKLVFDLEEGDPPITEEELSGLTEIVRSMSDHERESLQDPQLQEARAYYRFGEKVHFLGREYRVQGFKRHIDGNLQLVLRLTGKEIKKHPNASKFVYLKYPQCMQTVIKKE